MTPPWCNSTAVQRSLCRLDYAAYLRRFRCQHGQLLTEKADVYSLGMIFFALMAGRMPYYGKPELLESALHHRDRPEIDPSWHRGFMEVRTQVAKPPLSLRKVTTKMPLRTPCCTINNLSTPTRRRQPLTKLQNYLVQPFHAAK